MKDSIWLAMRKLLFSVAAIVLVFDACQKETKSKTIVNNIQLKAVPSTPKAEHLSAQVAVDWYKLQLRIILNANPAISPTVAGRIFAYTGIGLYESVRYGIKNSVSFSKKLYQMPAMPSRENNNGYNWEVSANTALASLVRSFYPGLTDQNKASIDSLEKAYNEMLLADLDLTAFQRSQSYGHAVAEAIFNWSKTDNDNQSSTGYVIPVFAGAWEKTPPAFVNPASPFLGEARPLLQLHVTGVGPVFPFPYSEIPSSDFYKMVKDIYDVSQTMTPEQRDIALFWNDIGVGRGYTPPGHSVSILNQLLEQKQISLGLAAEGYAKLGIALREALILCFRSKYHYNLVRPVTYIRKLINPIWLPLIGTPAHPEYPAAHAYVTMAAMEALSKLFGDNVAFIDHTYDFLGFAPRTFSKLTDAGKESGISRRYGGIHYLPSIETGWALGMKIGDDIGGIKLTE
jgi:hypothetical protein